MKTNQVIIPCYEDYLELCSSLKIRIQERILEKILKSFRTEFTDQLPYGSCLIDYSRNKFLQESPNSKDIIGFNLTGLPNGPASLLRWVHPEDRLIFCQQLFPDIIKFLSGIALQDYERYRFSFSYRLFRLDCNTTHLLQHNTYLEPTPDGKPLLNMLFFSDITDYKTDNRMKLTINYLTSDRGYVPIFKKYYILPQNKLFSERELEILKLSKEGLSGKMIAEKLFISLYTVKNHKRNMMDKSSTNNITELINFTTKNGIVV